MPRFIRLLALPLFALALAAPHAAQAQAKEEYRVLAAAEVLDELRAQRDDVIPERLLQRAYAIAVVPEVYKGAFILGARHGNGIFVVRDSRGRFSNPVFMSLTGGSVGWQIGGQKTDVVLVFTTRRGVEGLAGGKLTLGAGASVAAGPVGRQGEAAAGIDAEVFSYSRNSGLFAGVSLEGTALTIDDKANARFYGRKGLLASEIMSGAVTKDSENVRRFLTAVAASTGDSASKPAPAVPAPAAPGATAAPAAPGVRTFPMEDQKPGAEPR
jgi:lipid-binding SYLF domain-containing protein